MARLETTYAHALAPRDAEDYDAFVDRARGGAYAQTRAWASTAVAGRRFSPRFWLARRDGQVVGAALLLRARLAGPFGLPFAVVERGPVVDDMADLPNVLAALRRSTLGRGIGRLQVMPYFADEDADSATRILAQAGFRSVQAFDAAHAQTLRVDLRGKDAGSVFGGKAGEALRRKLRQAEKAGAVARTGTAKDVAILAALHGELMRGQARGEKSAAYYAALSTLVDEGSRGAVFVCEHDGEPISALFASRHGKLATFVIGASSNKDRPFSKMVPAMVGAIRWALEAGCEAFDMGGIPHKDDPDQKRKSIAQFKLDFAKTPVRLVEEHARWL